MLTKIGAAEGSQIGAAAAGVEPARSAQRTAQPIETAGAVA